MKFQMASSTTQCIKDFVGLAFAFWEWCQELPQECLANKKIFPQRTEEMHVKRQVPLCDVKYVACFISCPWGMQWICKATKGQKGHLWGVQIRGQEEDGIWVQGPLDELEDPVTLLQFIAMTGIPNPKGRDRALIKRVTSGLHLWYSAIEGY